MILTTEHDDQTKNTQIFNRLNATERKKISTRLRKIRILSRDKRLNDLPLRVDDMARFAGVSTNTYQNWEMQFGWFNQKHAHNLIKNLLYFRSIDVAYDWLIEGTGNPPKILKPTEMLRATFGANIEKTLQSKEISQALEQNLLFQHLKQDIASFYVTIIQGLEAICYNSPEMVILILTDNSMLPFYCAGDIVIGAPVIEDKAINKIINHDCLIKTSENKILFRNLQNSDKKKLYNLISRSRKFPMLEEASIDWAAPLFYVAKINPLPID